MISGRYAVWDLLVVLPPVLGAVQLLLPFAFRVRPTQIGRRAAALAAMWAVFAAAALGLPRVEQAMREELGGNGLASNSWIITTVFGIVMTALLASATATVVRECRKHVLMQPVAERELHVLRPLAAAVRDEGSGAAEWAKTAVDCAEEELRHGRGAQAVWLLRSAAETICEADPDGRLAPRAAASRDRLQAAGSTAKAFTSRDLDDPSTV
ncbi:hypothetical protein ACFV3R_10775 [Streptomyces sp. NPDC059740]|uniref:hypothetical protein n=1 Tax=Streptomyces sp. NPDC059740 TaxID=3346926 RepID=UPI003648058B